MANKVDIELITMPPNVSECTVWHESAIVFKNSAGDLRGIPWRSISKEEFSMDNALGIACIDGYDHYNPAVYCGINDGNEAVYVIYKQMV